MRTPRHRSAASRAGLIATPSPRPAFIPLSGVLPVLRRAASRLRQCPARALSSSSTARTLAALVVAFGLLFAGEAEAMHCRLRADAVKVLRDKFGESVTIEKVSPDGKSVTETWRNAETGTYTVLETQINGDKRVSCIVALGGGWFGDAPEKGEEL